MKRFFLAFYILSFAATIPVKSQPAPASYGKIDIGDLEMKVYAPDTSAEAIILCDYGVFNTNTYQFTRLLRIKILKKEGSGIVNRIYNISGTGFIKGCTYNLLDGAIVKSKLKNESIFREEVRDNYFRYRVTMPDVRVGSVVEVQYTFPLLPSEWSFQDIVPIRWSELRIPATPSISFNKIFFGFEPFYIDEPGRWVARDMPALRQEPYISSLKNYLNRAEIELSSINVPGWERFFTTSWDAVNIYLNNNKLFGASLGLGTFVNEDARNIKALNLPEVDRMKAACDTIKKRLKWNEQESLYTSSDLGYVFKKGGGNSADVNLVLVHLLKKLDLKSFPIALSTRENGFISPSFPTIDKLNYVIAGVNYNGKIYFFDATEPSLPAGMLPFRALNGRGRIIDPDLSGWVDLSPAVQQRELVYCQMKLEETGEITGSITYRENDYAGFYHRKDLIRHNSHDEHVKELESKFPGLTVGSFKVENLENLYEPETEIYEVSLTGYADNIGDMISISPMLIEKMQDNPFKLQSRKYPIDYGHPIKNRYVLYMIIPEGYEPVELPMPFKLDLPDKSGEFTYNMIINANVIQLVVNFEISKAIFMETEYPVVREFYNQVIAKQAEVIMLRKKI